MSSTHDISASVKEFAQSSQPAVVSTLSAFSKRISTISANHPLLDTLRKKYYQWLIDTHQEGKAGELKEQEGDDMATINLYMKAGLPARVARVVSSRDELMNNTELVGRIASALIKADMYERAGDLYEKVGKYQEALQNYKKGHAYRRAVELSLHAFPHDVMKLEEEWGDNLVQQKQLDGAINHFIEAGATLKAADAAVNSRQWRKAVQILEVLPSNRPEVQKYYKKIAQHHANMREYELAEQYYRTADSIKEAIDMYNTACKWEEAYRLASTCMKKEEIIDLYTKQAEALQQKGRYKDAERLYITVCKADVAVQMYKKLRMYNDVIRLVKQYFKDHLEATHQQLAKTEQIYKNKPYDESLELPDSEEVASQYSPTPRVEIRKDKAKPVMSDESDDDIQTGGPSTGNHQKLNLKSNESKMMDLGGGSGARNNNAADDSGSTEDDDDDENDDDDDEEHGHIEGLYNPADYEHLAVSPDIKELFQYITRAPMVILLSAMMMLIAVFFVDRHGHHYRRQQQPAKNAAAVKEKILIQTARAGDQIRRRDCLNERGPCVRRQPTTRSPKLTLCILLILTSLATGDAQKFQKPTSCQAKYNTAIAKYVPNTCAKQPEAYGRFLAYSLEIVEKSRLWAFAASAVLVLLYVVEVIIQQLGFVPAGIAPNSWASYKMHCFNVYQQPIPRYFSKLQSIGAKGGFGWRLKFMVLFVIFCARILALMCE